eukprot:GHVU01157871.1.p1 GENE.GHVU01157871.1~~GHVU01157871.1.p1  ORF type:complete len:432 (+),score=72.55 GHVU01157871.1:526-1821(+)
MSPKLSEKMLEAEPSMEATPRNSNETDGRSSCLDGSVSPSVSTMSPDPQAAASIPHPSMAPIGTKLSMEFDKFCGANSYRAVVESPHRKLAAVLTLAACLFLGLWCKMLFVTVESERTARALKKEVELLRVELAAAFGSSHRSTRDGGFARGGYSMFSGDGFKGRGGGRGGGREGGGEGDDEQHGRSSRSGRRVVELYSSGVTGDSGSSGRLQLSTLGQQQQQQQLKGEEAVAIAGNAAAKVVAPVLLLDRTVAADNGNGNGGVGRGVEDVEGRSEGSSASSSRSAPKTKGHQPRVVPILVMYKYLRLGVEWTSRLVLGVTAPLFRVVFYTFLTAVIRFLLGSLAVVLCILVGLRYLIRRVPDGRLSEWGAMASKILLQFVMGVNSETSPQHDSLKAGSKLPVQEGGASRPCLPRKDTDPYLDSSGSAGKH